MSISISKDSSTGKFQIIVSITQLTAQYEFYCSFGLNGAACVKRAICEMSEAPLSSNGLLGKAVELILT